MNIFPWFRSGLITLAMVLLVPAGVRAAEGVDPAKPAPAVPNSECLDCHEAVFKPRKNGSA